MFWVTVGYISSTYRGYIHDKQPRRSKCNGVASRATYLCPAVHVEHVFWYRPATRPQWPRGTARAAALEPPPLDARGAKITGLEAPGKGCIEQAVGKAFGDAGARGV